MVFRPGLSADTLPRSLPARVLGGFLLAALCALPAAAQSQLLPAGFFDAPITLTRGAVAVEADRLSYDARADVIAAEGTVKFAYGGYLIEADRIQYDQRNGELLAVGNVRLREPGGALFVTERVEITGELKDVFIDSMSVTTATGAIVTARSVHYADALATILTEASYSPCGLCIDSKGRKIGWKVKAAKLIYDRDKAAVVLEQPSLELLGIPVAWLPWFWVPDPTQPRATGLRMPSVDWSVERGAQLAVPFFVPVGEDVDLLLTPTLMSRQGFLARADMSWRLLGAGIVEVKAAGLYQLDRSAFAGTVGDRDWRGAIQTTGTFTPAEDWTAGWSYTAFTDNAFLPDYKLDSGAVVNEAYATHLSGQSWFDARVQQFKRLGNYNETDNQQQGMNLPNIRFEHVEDLAEGWGRVRLNGQLLGVHRALDQSRTYNGVPYDWGFAGNKAHAMVEGGWGNQMILPGGLAATPYLGLRLDGAWYDGGSPHPLAPPAQMLFNATPIAAMDVRWPLMAFGGGGTHLVEPIAQLVYRGSGVTAVGISNDDAQSFVFDTSNLFDYNRFSGIDRQETGLRANIGGHYLGTFEDGSWLDLVAGQSFHLAGSNALGITDQVQIGTATGLGAPASFIVASARGGLASGLSAGAKMQVDPAAWKITRAGIGFDYAPGWFSLGADYIYVAATPVLGVTADQHELAGRASLRLDDYWTVNGGLTWNLATNSWIKANSGLGYDDGYLVLGGNVNFTPTSWGLGFNFKLKGPDGEVAF